MSQHTDSATRTINGPVPPGAHLVTEKFLDHPTEPRCTMANLIRYRMSGRYFLICERGIWQVTELWGMEHDPASDRYKGDHHQ
jgi:hypothetical protein